MKAQAFINIIISISYLKVIYSYNYIVGNKANIKIEIPEPPYSYIFYYFQLNIYICKYINNDSYVELGNSIEKISESNFYTYPKSFNNKMININGSDLKFIDYGVTVNLCDQEAYNVLSVVVGQTIFVDFIKRTIFFSLVLAIGIFNCFLKIIKFVYKLLE